MIGWMTFNDVHFGVNTSGAPLGKLANGPTLLLLARRLGVGMKMDAALACALRALTVVDDAESSAASAERVIGLGRSKKLGDASGDI